MNDLARDVTDATFNEEVVERSKTVPVLVDLWAPWCGPCRALTPVLERVASDANGGFELVKVNIDENPTIANQLGARSIPLVIAFKDGEAVSSFVGAQPEGAVRKFVGELVPSETDLMLEDAERAISQDRAGDAETILRTALENDPRNENTRLVLARLLADNGETEDAIDVLVKADPSLAVQQLRSQIRLADGGGEHLADLETSAMSGSMQAKIEFAQALHSSGDHSKALDQLIEVLRIHPEQRDGAAKQVMLDIFNVLGQTDPLVRTYRRKLGPLLY